MRHEERQLWGFPSADVTSSPQCTAFPIPSGALIILNKTATITIGAGAQFSPACTGTVFVTDFTNGTTENDFDGPFYTSTTPLIYIVAATTVLAWILLIITLVIPARIKNNTSDQGPGFLTGRGLIGGMSARKSSGANGSRPWLQKVAALAVSIALTIATADTFRVAQQQYALGYLSAQEMRDQVSGSTEIRIMRVVSDVFLWLAQVQTLIRLFPRHKEKLVIKWIGFLLIILDVVFSCLNSFLVRTITRPRSYQDAIPALSYLFQLSLSLLYAAWVFYYAITQRRFAFYNRKMPNICIIAAVSMIAIMVPVAFFVADVAQPDVAAWGDYFRWVGAAAGSIVVWEWVERIETLESDERSEGILGREVFEGDDMLGHRPNNRTRPNNHKDGEVHDSRWNGSTAIFGGFGGLASRLVRSRPTRRPDATKRPKAKGNAKSTPDQSLTQPETAKSATTSSESDSNPPLNVSSPVDRENTASAVSAASTVYAVRYPPTSPSPHIQERGPFARIRPPVPRAIINGESSTFQNNNSQKPFQKTQKDSSKTHPQKITTSAPAWVALAHPFKRKRTTPPIEMQNTLSSGEQSGTVKPPGDLRKRPVGKPDAKNTGRRIRFGKTQYAENVEFREPTIIPAPPRSRTWSPDAFQNGISGIHSITEPMPSSELQDPQNRNANFNQSLQFAYTNHPRQEIPDKAGNQSTDGATPHPTANHLHSGAPVTSNHETEDHPSQNQSSPQISVSGASSSRGSQSRIENDNDDGRVNNG